MLNVVCNICHHEWQTTYDLLSDKNVKIIGYQRNFKNLSLGFLLFSHSCSTTIAVPVKNFLFLYKGEIFKENKTNSKECPKYCLQPTNLLPCPVKCECVYVRELIQIIKNYEKNIDN